MTNTTLQYEIDVKNERLNETSALYELDDAYHIWDHTDDWDLKVFLDEFGWVIVESVWARSPLGGSRHYFKRELLILKGGRNEPDA